MTNSKKIVVVRYRFIGDTLLSIPFLRALRQREPEARIHLLTGEDAYLMMRECPYVDEVISFEPRKLGFWNAVKKVRDGNYDTAYILKRSFSSALIMRLAGIPSRIGFNTEKRGFLLTKAAPYRCFEKHEAECFMDLLMEDLRNGKDKPDLTLETWIPEITKDKVRSIVNHSKKPAILLHPGSTNRAKCWPLRNFQIVAEALVSTYKAQIYLLGAYSEYELYESFLNELSPECREYVTNLCGKTTILESMAVLNHMNLVIANDSGMIHMAAASKIPVIVIFGPMDPGQWRPLTEQSAIITHPNLSCRPCRMKISCNHRYPCLTEISPERVLDECKAWLKF